MYIPNSSYFLYQLINQKFKCLVFQNLFQHKKLSFHIQLKLNSMSKFYDLDIHIYHYFLLHRFNSFKLNLIELFLKKMVFFFYILQYGFLLFFIQLFLFYLFKQYFFLLLLLFNFDILLLVYYFADYLANQYNYNVILFCFSI